MLEEELAQLPPGALKDFLAATPLRREGAAAEVSGCVLFLASDDSSFVSGAELVVDGGLLAGR
jgi:NAD(P)-dependent dehydrogenase (short-subunit alcohol dehydrogenase family)